MKKPITQKAKSPLKQTDSAGAILGQSTSTYTPGKSTTTTSGGSSVPRAKGGSRRATDTEAYIRGLKKRFPDATGQELKEKGYISSAYVDRFPEAVETTVTEPGKTVTRDEEYTPMIQDKYTGITPWENRFNMRTLRQSERFGRKEAKRDLRRLAKEAARDARQAGEGFGAGRKAKRDIMTGKSFQNETQERLYNQSRGLTEEQNRSVSSDMQRNQYEKGITRGEQFLGTAREMTDADASTQRGQEVIGRHQGYNPDYKYKPKTTVTETTTYDDGTTSTTTAGGGASSMPGKIEPGKTAGTTGPISPNGSNVEKDGAQEVLSKDAPLVDGTPTRENRPPMAPTQMRYEQNIGIKQRAPMKKGYFKNK